MDLFDKPDDANWDDLEPGQIRLDDAVTKRLYRRWRAPRYGQANPERMNNPVWEWLVRSRATAYDLTARLSERSALKAGPGWCFSRHGQSETTLPDGRRVFIGGEHEDFYDPDFFIYNDVVVLHPDRRIDIFGYPRELFPPTDFHSATLVGDRIFIIGCAGYPEQYPPGVTPVFCLDLNSFAVSRFPASGPMPGNIQGHIAELAPDGWSITVREGRGESGRNINDWRLQLDTGVWVSMTDRRWQIWQVNRKDEEPIHLWQIRTQLLMKQAGQAELLDKQMRQFREQFNIPTLEEEVGGPIDAQAVAQLYQPSVKHQSIPGSGFGMQCICIDEVVVRYKEDMEGIEVTFEGDLPQKVIDTVMKDLETKLTRVEGSPCKAKRVETK